MKWEKDRKAGRVMCELRGAKIPNGWPGEFRMTRLQKGELERSMKSREEVVSLFPRPHPFLKPGCKLLLGSGRHYSDFIIWPHLGPKNVQVGLYFPPEMFLTTHTLLSCFH